MHNPGDDTELDRLSRDAARKYDVPGKANWQKMQRELDKVMPVEKNPLSSFLFWLLPLLLLVGTSYWLLTKKNFTIPVKENIVAGKTDNSILHQHPSTQNKASAITKENNTEHTQVTGVGKVNQLPDKNLSVQLSAIRKRIEKISLPPYHSSSPGIEEHTGTQSSALINQASKQTDLKRQEPNAVVADVKNTVVYSKKGAPEKSIGNPITAAPEIKEQSSDTPVEPEKKITQSTASNLHTPFTSFGKGWSVSFLAGFDKSTVKFRYGNDPGLNFGIIGGYHFNKHISIHTGFIYTQKNYKLAGEDFTAPKGGWLSYYKLENVDGYCRMWEVPLLLRYAVSNTGKNNYFVSTGLSSYFMTTENYNYFFYYQGQPITKNAAYFSGNKYILSILHLSAGFENRLSKNLSLQIEPYAKLPLVGVGLGDIQLSSFGINFALQSRQAGKK